ncbi:Tyrosine-protein kinase ABL1 [Holothuria leucospilota]|uniref:Tyrosine-protein kinase n=1 Tax=Holothuria leucospilota TaxID=206669 RepID=A0A9Q1BW11_HOLLE|nr:Tyrosine-protein kinase ABL1 [Holothuria leucospilota]
MGCCRSKDDSRTIGGIERYPTEGGLNSRSASETASRHSHVPFTTSFTDINNSQFSLTGASNQPSRIEEQDIIPLIREYWYFGKIDIDRCTKVLGDGYVPDGTFIVRESTSSSGTLCISVKGRSPKGPGVFSVRVTESKDRFGYKLLRSGVDNKVFTSIRNVIRYYQDNGIHSNGLSISLGEGLKNKHYYLGEDEEEDRSFQIKSEDIDVQSEQLGKGHFGIVYKGVWKKRNGQQVLVAVKKLIESDKEELEKFITEANVMKMVYHDNVVTFVGVYFEENQNPVIVTELMPKGNLLNYLTANKDTSLGDLYYFAYQVAAGMTFIASKNIIHRDLAARNVLLGEQHIVKIADFGLSRVLKQDEIYSSSIAEFPVKWTAPEGLAPPPRYFSTKSDVWSYGIFLSELITRGEEPYKSVPHISITKDRLIHQGYRMQKENLGEDCSLGLYAIMEKCWQSDPQQRPDFKTVAADIRRLYKPHLLLQQL